MPRILSRPAPHCRLYRGVLCSYQPVVQRGAHLATVPYNILDQLLKQSLTDVGLQRFLADWSQLQEAVSAPVR